MRAPFEIDAAVKPRRVDRDVRGCGDHCLAREYRRLRGGSGSGCARHRRSAGLRGRRRGLCRAGLRRTGLRRTGLRRTGLRRTGLRRTGLRVRLLLLFEQRLMALPFHLRIADEILPADHDEQRQHDGEDGVLVLVHSTLLRRVFGRLCGRLSASARLLRPGR